jgi:hypothetical protein
MFRRTLFAFTAVAALAGSLMLPSSAQAATGVTVRVYDRSHKDYHPWNSDEDRIYRQYLTDNHRPYRRITKTTRTQQTAYWQFRHTSDHR